MKKKDRFILQVEEVKPAPPKYSLEERLGNNLVSLIHVGSNGEQTPLKLDYENLMQYCLVQFRGVNWYGRRVLVYEVNPNDWYA